ncbi:MAG: hypothetical protein WBX11_02130 [Thiobacillaceae bacterium]
MSSNANMLPNSCSLPVLIRDADQGADTDGNVTVKQRVKGPALALCVAREHPIVAFSKKLLQ